MKADPTKKIRALASKKSYGTGEKVFINFNGEKYALAKKQSAESVFVYKNGNEIAI